MFTPDDGYDLEKRKHGSSLEFSEVVNRYVVLCDPVDIVYWDFQKTLTIYFKKEY